ncbi:helix-turn-helix domain-containing protein (plasmid) [Hymenobacter tibetensis]|uniref:Helix-turn-helix domain-containing protein n=1 Tax=Hymenobacter tibetensis TaxID=497967 RepID=A0ABY4D7A5_9BACT|nr:helix-turn-helix domain-containing protein [Hymenobacter tibetensis]UOG77475.1 helix-turn-helix domain-containing protein [Hymenobacter tibetensis]
MALKQLNRNAEMVVVCSGDQRYGGEKTYEDHVLVGVLAGELKVVQADRTYYCAAGETVLLPRNQPATLIKYPKEGAAYQAVVLKLPTALVRAYYAENVPVPARPAASGLLLFSKSPLLQSLFASLLPYLELQHPVSEKLLAVKVAEAMEILRTLDPRSDGVLANFFEPGKINLVEFMEANYRFNMSLTTFGYLTGRSLTTFKRDFQKAFHLSPQRWLTQKRLELAHYQLTEKSRKPVELYLEVGFENLAHFSYAFKKHFGYPPTALLGQANGHQPAPTRNGKPPEQPATLRQARVS